MHHASNRRFHWLALGALAMSLTSMGAMAANSVPSSGLGQSWPNATDVSASPHWHVYVFQRNGVRYVQINDLNGKVRAAFATASGSFLTLPVGSDAARVATPDEPLPAAGNTKGDIVYQDSTVKVLVAPQADGSTATYAAAGDCHDPVECSSRVQSPSAKPVVTPQAPAATRNATVSSGDCHDPVECSSRAN